MNVARTGVSSAASMAGLDVDGSMTVYRQTTVAKINNWFHDWNNDTMGNGTWKKPPMALTVQRNGSEEVIVPMCRTICRET